MSNAELIEIRDSYGSSETMDSSSNSSGKNLKVDAQSKLKNPGKDTIIVKVGKKNGKATGRKMNRRDKRVTKKLMVNVNDDGADYLGLTCNISRYGMCVASTRDFDCQKEVVVALAVPGDVFNLKGEIMWCRQGENVTNGIPENIGIRITEAPPEYLNFVEYLKHKNIPLGQPEF